MLAAILFNRLAEGLDGALARLTGRTSDTGGFLDIGLDFVFYSAAVLGFALADPQANALVAALLLFAFVGTRQFISGFRDHGCQACLERLHFESKAFYYLHELTEGTETILAFVVFYLWPHSSLPPAWSPLRLACGTAIERSKRTKRELPRFQVQPA